ncbi:pentatricopeptide repeat-containing protein At4g02750 [Cryptomeria japonica]|uniref:pentatricopeptide repeat-containing protein At4g02750 n=1 Tax=Cryptomeria japonica TaxID=3369 RepID=UPI0027DA9875|nr:pentatricopeptide repeat-containing protein At4g02750 [Cryptomeria japonica]
MTRATPTHLNLTACRPFTEGQLKERLNILLATHKSPEDYSTDPLLLHTCILKNTLFTRQNCPLFPPISSLTGNLSLLHAQLFLISLLICMPRKLFTHIKERDNASWSTIIAAHRRSGYTHEAFQYMHHRYAISWTAIVAGYKQNVCVDKSFQIFNQMQLAGVNQNSTTFASILPVCAKAKLGLWNRMPQRDVVSWNAVIAGYAQHGFVDKAFETFKQVQLADTNQTPKSFAGILPACAKTGALDQGMDIHNSIMEGGFLLDIMVGNAPVDMYAKCRRI